MDQDLEKGGPQFDATCLNCGKTGHRVEDYWLKRCVLDCGGRTQDKSKGKRKSLSGKQQSTG